MSSMKGPIVLLTGIYFLFRLKIFDPDTGTEVNTLDVLWEYWIGQNNIESAVRSSP